MVCFPILTIFAVLLQVSSFSNMASFAYEIRVLEDNMVKRWCRKEHFDRGREFLGDLISSDFKEREMV